MDLSSELHLRRGVHGGPIRATQPRSRDKTIGLKKNVLSTTRKYFHRKTVASLNGFGLRFPWQMDGKPRRSKPVSLQAQKQYCQLVMNGLTSYQGQR